MGSKPVPVRLTVEEAKEKIAAMQGTILFEKVLTSSDVNGTGRLVIPKSQAEAHFPHLEQQSGMSMDLTDTEGKIHTFRFRFWVNNQSRMYLLENTAAVQAKYRMQAGDVLVFSKLPEGHYGICGRKGTKDDISRKPPTRRAPSGTPSEGGSPSGAVGAKRVRGRGDSLKARRLKQKQAAQEIQSLLTYWSGHSLPMRKDGVFRAVPNNAIAEGDKVVAQYGAWSAVVSMGGELYQAFFDTHEAANAALQASLQSAGREEGGGAARSRRTVGEGPGPGKAVAAAGDAPVDAARVAAEAAGALAAGSAMQQPKQEPGEEGQQQQQPTQQQQQPTQQQQQQQATPMNVDTKTT